MSPQRTAKKMSDTANYIDLGPRTAFWARNLYGSSVAKRLARDLDTSEGTAKRILAGGRPTTEQLQTLARLWGWRFVHFVFEPTIGEAAFDARLSDLAGRIDALKAELEDRP